MCEGHPFFFISFFFLSFFLSFFSIDGIPQFTRSPIPIPIPMADCRSLIEFLRAFEQHRRKPPSAPSPDRHRPCSRSRRISSRGFWNPLSHPFCDHSPFAAIDVLLLVLVLSALAFLMIPYMSLALSKSYYFLRFVSKPYLIGMAVSFVFTVLLWGFVTQQVRKCGNPNCKGLRKAVEFDIQLETEECVKHLKPLPRELIEAHTVELSTDHKELEAELRKMAPMNGRTVLIFRSPCGCPKGRMEVWGPRKVRRVKK